MKNKFLMLMIVGLIFPLGGFGMSGISNIYAIDKNTEIEGDFSLISESNGLENGFNFFIYFDALPKDLAIEYNREYRFQLINAKLTYGELSSIAAEMSSYRTSDYLTLKKEVFGLSIPFLAKAALHLGGGVNQHNSVVPSITLLKDILDEENLSDLYTDFNPDDIDTGDFMKALVNHSNDATGLHIQAGVQGKLLILNAFINARYTFIMDSDEMKNFPGLTVGFAYGI